MARSLLADWRDAIRDSGLTRTEKLVGLTLSTYMSAEGRAYPSKETLARGCSLSDRAVDRAVDVLEAAEFLEVRRTRGGNGRSNLYIAALPEKRTENRAWPSRERVSPSRERGSSNGVRRSHESAESARSSALGADSPSTGDAPAPCEECGIGGGYHASDCVRGMGGLS